MVELAREIHRELAIARSFDQKGDRLFSPSRAILNQGNSSKRMAIEM